MPSLIEAKICGLTDRAAVDAAGHGGARYGGLVFYPPSPRTLALDQAAALAAGLPSETIAVGVFVDPGDDLLARVVARVGLGMVQLHGSENPARVAEVRARFGLPVIKAVPIAGADDVAAARAFEAVADRLLFDAKSPVDDTDSLPGGNGLAFDWRLLAKNLWSRPWLLSGGLDADNVAEAVRLSNARAVDVSSGVEARPGVKDPARVAAFLSAAAAALSG